MTPWTDLEAEVILDEVTAHDGWDDLRGLQAAIAKALHRAYQLGRSSIRPDEYTG